MRWRKNLLAHGSRRPSFRERFRPEVTCHRVPIQVQDRRDLTVGGAGRVKFVHVVVDIKPLLPLAFAGFFPCGQRNRLRLGKLEIAWKYRQIRTRSWLRVVFQARPHRLVMAVEQAFDGFANVLQEMPAVRDLHRLGCPVRRGVRILRRPVARDDLHAGMRLAVGRRRSVCDMAAVLPDGRKVPDILTRTHHQIRGRTVFKRPMSAPVKSAGSRE